MFALPTSLLPPTLPVAPARHVRREPVAEECKEKEEEKVEEKCSAQSELQEASNTGDDDDDDTTDVIVVEGDAMERTHTLRELRQMCTDRGLSASGKKVELVARLKAT